MPWPTAHDDELFGLIDREVERQNTTLQLIASENFASPAVMKATGSVLTNKYSEGYPTKRYYGGNEVIDQVEDLARERAKALFGAEHANVQPHSGADANMAAYMAVLEPGDTVLGLRLDQGGHLTHGSPVNASGRLFRFVSYGVTPSDERIDLDQVRDLALDHRPKLIVAGATAYPRTIDPEPFRRIADEVGAPRAGTILSTAALADKLDKSVFPGYQGGPHDHVIAAKAVAFHEAAQPEFGVYARQIVANASALASALAGTGLRLVSGGTDNHLMLVDMRSFDPDVSGKKARLALDRAGISLNENTVPDDPRPPYITSGLRIGTPAVTTQGMGEAEMADIGELIHRTLVGREDEAEVAAIRDEVVALCSKFAPYPA
jgi:glycine hydroxymethyltransferase